ncbi:MAG: DNA-deoxyinosine glycosylase [Sphaerochaeta sp.]|jgi:TDG/mug DNA glycosylase family protein|uniref:DNA-deoxyinosine glycosylase n=1 Tax=Sphaerochaeta sp. TaxID=1972642 RepID=UPI002FCA9CAD
MLNGFPPIHTKHSTRLILGTGPSIRSAQKQQYYGHERNAFWPIMADVFGGPIRTYEEKCELLIAHDIALWDVLERFERKLSSDSAFTTVVANDLQSFLVEHPAISTVLFNGQKACSFYKSLIKFHPASLHFETLPSTSPAYTLAYAQKLERWQAALMEA